MCGIAGLIVQNEIAYEVIPRLEAMVSAQRHRGPDDEGIQVLHYENPAVIFGHRRLAIIDLSPAGHQPMYDPETGNWIVFNGEIYNFQELRIKLEMLGYIFRTRTDTEVILKAYAHWGPGCVHRLRGIFAFGIWQVISGRPETSNLRLFLARDQLGVKPLYYWQHNDALLFASEVRALLASGLVPRRMDLCGLRSWLAYGSVQEPYTLVQGVRSLLPGHTLTWEDGQVRNQRYWRLPGPEAVKSERPADLFEQMGIRLAEAVRLQLVADVPLGSFLSGGIDSTAIAALMRRSATGPVKTFSIVFDEKPYDERVYSQIAAQHIGTDHTELLLRGEDVRNTLPRVLPAIDQPSVDGLNTYFVSKVTREAGLIVALSGLGGDELFGGYNGYRKALLVERWGLRFRDIPPFLRRWLSEVLYSLPWREAGIAAELLQNQRQPYFFTRQIFSSRQVTELLAPEILKESLEWEPFTFSQLGTETRGYDPINRASAFELQTYMASTLLRDTDQMSMAHGLEVRVPLLDHLLVEYLFTLPGKCKLDPVHPKPLLTLPLSGTLPHQCVYRPKRGFELPFAVWLRDVLDVEMQASFANQSPDSVFPFTVRGLERFWTQFKQGQLGWSRVWGLFVLLNWLSRYRVTA